MVTFFQVDSGSLHSISVYCMSDFENENEVKIENGIESLGNVSRSGLGEYTQTVKQSAE